MGLVKIRPPRPSAVRGVGLPFLFDTAVQYVSSRDTKEKYAQTAKEHGFDKRGCPVVIGDKGNIIKVEVGGKKDKLYGFEVAKELCDADCVLSIAHGKGHLITGFGGSIKAFGMGGVSKESKTFIHMAAKPVMTDSEACRLCATCVEGCPVDAIKISDDKWVIDYVKCVGCERCIRACPSGVLEWKKEEFDLMLVGAARACLNEFGAKNKPRKNCL